MHKCQGHVWFSDAVPCFKRIPTLWICKSIFQNRHDSPHHSCALRLLSFIWVRDLVTSLSLLWSDNILTNDGQTESHVFNSYFEILRVSQITHVKCWSGSLQGEMTHTHTPPLPLLSLPASYLLSLSCNINEMIWRNCWEVWLLTLRKVMRVWPNCVCTIVLWWQVQIMACNLLTT